MITIDLDAGQVTVDDAGVRRTFALGSSEGFAVVSRAWLRAGWDAKYVYSFTWLGRPIIQLPEDMLRIQELLFAVAPDVIIETGVAHGGSLVFYASLCKAMSHGRVIGVDIDIRPHNRRALETHFLAPLIHLVEGSSTSREALAAVKAQIQPDDKVFVVLDSNHTKQHVLAELHAYAPLVTPGSYIVAMDGIMGELAGAPRAREDWSWNNPREAAREFVAGSEGFVIDEPLFEFNEGAVSERVTYWPGGIIKRR